jgi:CHASE2 domain-containing sensor protein
MSTDANDVLQRAIETTRAQGHGIEETLKSESRSLSLAGRKLHSAVAKAAEYQSAEVTRGRSLLEEIRIRAAWYSKLRDDLDQVIEENRRQGRIVSAALRGAIAGAAAMESDLTRSPDE